VFYIINSVFKFILMETLMKIIIKTFLYLGLIILFISCENKGKVFYHEQLLKCYQQFDSLNLAIPNNTIDNSNFIRDCITGSYLNDFSLLTTKCDTLNLYSIKKPILPILLTGISKLRKLLLGHLRQIPMTQMRYLK